MITLSLRRPSDQFEHILSRDNHDAHGTEAESDTVKINN